MSEQQKRTPEPGTASPGMDAITRVYCGLFLAGYLFFFWELLNGWAVGP